MRLGECLPRKNTGFTINAILLDCVCVVRIILYAIFKYEKEMQL